MFDEPFMATIGVDFKIQTVEIDGKIIKLQIWDTAGQERFRTITHAYYRGVSGAVIVYDVTKQETFDNVKFWLQEISQFGNENCQKLLIGNKCDLVHQKVVDTQAAEELSQSLGISFLETSAKNSINVEKAFVTLSLSILKQREENPVTYLSERNKIGMSVSSSSS